MSSTYSLSKFSREFYEADEYPFFYNAPNNPQIFHITCKEISLNNASQLLNKTNNSSPNPAIYIFYYQLSNEKFFRVTCEMVSHSLIVQFLNKNILGIELKQCGQQQQEEYLEFSAGQKDYLEYHLKQFLCSYLTPKQIENGEPSNSNMIKQDNSVDEAIIHSDTDNNNAPRPSRPRYLNKL